MHLADEDLLSMQEAAQLLGVSMPTLYAIVDEREELQPAIVRYHGQQKRRYFRRSDVEELRQKRAGKTV